MHPDTEPSQRPRRCSIADALEVVGDRWSLLVLRELGFGNHRFTDIVRATGAPRDVMTARLRKLETAGVIARRGGGGARAGYELSPAGAELAPVLLCLKEWGDRHLNPQAPPVVTTHGCGARFHPRLHCAACGETLDPGGLTVAAGDAPTPYLSDGDPAA